MTTTDRTLTMLRQHLPTAEQSCHRGIPGRMYIVRAGVITVHVQVMAPGGRPHVRAWDPDHHYACRGPAAEVVPAVAAWLRSQAFACSQAVGDV